MSMLDTLLDPSRRAEAARDQEKAREEFGHQVNRHPALIEYLHGLTREQHALQALESIYALSEDERDSSTLTILLSRLAEGYGLQARFKEAADVAPDGAHKTQYEAWAQALGSIGVRRCNCPPAVNQRSPNDAKGQNFPTSTVIKEVSDGKRVIALTRCSLCYVISARVSQ